MAPISPIRTDRLWLRRFTPSDGAALHAYLSLPEAVRFEPYGVQTLAQCEEEAYRRRHDPAFWAVWLADSAELIGHLSLHPDPGLDQEAELGYVFHPARWGRGYASEAVQSLLAAAFAAGELRRVHASCHPANTASWRLLDRCGFIREPAGSGPAPSYRYLRSS